MSDDQTFHDAIEGYCDRLSYWAGDRVRLHVSTHATAYDVQVERWGASRDEVWHRHNVTGRFHEVPGDADAEGCGWPSEVEFAVDPEWRSGFYLITLTAHDAEPGRHLAHAGFVVRGPAEGHRRSGALLVLATNTWQAYNTWGGQSLYTGATKVSFGRPFGRGMLSRPETERDDRKSRPVHRGEAPDVEGAIFQAHRTERDYPSAIGSTGWFTYERRFVEWAEARGYAFDMAVSSDLDEDATALDGYSCVMSIGHDEYWSAGQRDAIERHVRGGGNVASLSGNTCFWQVRHEAGRNAPAMVCHKYRAHLDDPVLSREPTEITGLWADPLVARPEWSLLGAGSAFGLYHRFGMATPRGIGGFVIYRDDHWLLAGTGLTYGDVLGADDGVVGYETVGCPITFDDLQLPVAAPRDGLPADIEIVAFTPSTNLGVGGYPASIAAKSDQGDLEFIAERVFGGTDPSSIARARHGNAVILTCLPYGSSGGEVVTIGSTDWVFGLGDPAVAQVSANLLDRLK